MNNSSPLSCPFKGVWAFPESGMLIVLAVSMHWDSGIGLSSATFSVDARLRWLASVSVSMLLSWWFGVSLGYTQMFLAWLSSSRLIGWIYVAAWISAFEESLSSLSLSAENHLSDFLASRAFFYLNLGRWEIPSGLLCYSSSRGPSCLVCRCLTESCESFMSFLRCSFAQPSRSWTLPIFLVIASSTASANTDTLDSILFLMRDRLFLEFCFFFFVVSSEIYDLLREGVYNRLNWL